MRVLHVPFCFYPDPVGGTEIYVANLCRALGDVGVQTLIGAPASAPASYRHEGLDVRRFAIGAHVEHVRDLYSGAGDATATAQFAALLDTEQPDIVHLHAFNRGASLDMLAAARLRSIPAVFTYHLPGVTCQRGTLLRWGAVPCDGQLRPHRCASCTLHGLGLPMAASQLLGRVPRTAGRGIAALGLQGKAWTALQMPALIDARKQSLRALLAACARVVVLCAWAEQLLVTNGARREQLLLSRHGITYTLVAPRLYLDSPELRVAFVGRMYPIKGADVLIRAMRARPELPVRLDLYGVTQEEQSVCYLAWLRQLAEGDARISFFEPVPNSEVIGLLAGYDLLAVPSQWLETGPLVVLEAFAAGTPVLGSRLGGIAELVRDGIDGLLVEPASVQLWAKALAMLAQDRPRLAQLRAAVRPPRTMAIVATEMRVLYEELQAAQQP